MAIYQQDELAEKLHQRLLIVKPTTDFDFCMSLAALISRSGIELTMNSFTPNGVVINDFDGRTVGLYRCSSQNGYLLSEAAPYTEVIVVDVAGMVIGWLDSRRVNVSGDSFTIGTDSLMKMPKEFAFRQPCPHLAEFGGLWRHEESAWECFGCGVVIPDLINN